MRKVWTLTDEEAAEVSGSHGHLIGRCDDMALPDDIAAWIDTWLEVRRMEYAGDKMTPPGEELILSQDDFLLLIDPQEAWPIHVRTRVDGEAVEAKLVEVLYFQRHCLLHYVLEACIWG